MKRILEKRVLPVLAAVCLLVTMVAVATSFASAADPGTYDGDNYVPKTIGYRIGSFELNSGEVLSYDSDLFFTGDSLKNNQGNWWKDYDGKWSYTGEDVTYVSGNVYWLRFNNSTTNEEKRVAVGRGDYGNLVLTAGEWEVSVELERATDADGINYGKKILLVDTFTVVDPSPELIPSSETSSDTPSGSTSDTSSDSIDFGHEDTTVEYKCRTIKMFTKGGIIDDYKTSTSAPSNLVEFDTYCVNIGGVSYAAFCVGDSLKNICWWRDYNFTSGSSTGKITNAYLKTTGLDMQMQVGYGHTTGGSDSAYVFEKPGEYRLVTGDLGGEKEIAKFYVFWPTQDIADQIFVASGAIDHGQEDPSVKYTPRTINMSAIGGDLEAYKTDKTKPSNLVNFDTDYITVDGAEFAAFCVGDEIVNTNAWRNFYFQFESDGVLQPCTVDTVYLYCDDPSYYAPMNVGYGYTCGSTNAPIRFLQAGEYYMVAVAGGARYEIARFHVFWPTQDIVNQLSGETEQTEYNCDVNSDGVVDSRDLIVLQMRILGLLNN